MAPRTHTDPAAEPPATDMMLVGAATALVRCGLAPHIPALLALLAADHPAALPDDLTETVDLRALLGGPAELSVTRTDVVARGEF
jgi:hypothetical protein